MASDPLRAEATEARLWQLLEERTAPGADRESIDRTIWDLFGEERSVMFTDLAGFSRQVEAFGIIHFLQLIHEHKRLLSPILASGGGTLIKVEADSLLVVFDRPDAALVCAVEMQRACDRANVGRGAEDRILLCVGIGHGRILLIGDTDVYGAEVNAASKLGEDIAKAGDIFVTDSVKEHAGEIPGISYDPLEISVPGSAKNHVVRYRS